MIAKVSEIGNNKGVKRKTIFSLVSLASMCLFFSTANAMARDNNQDQDTAPVLASIRHYYCEDCHKYYYDCTICNKSYEVKPPHYYCAECDKVYFSLSFSIVR